MPFWRGEGSSRTPELGEAVGVLCRELAAKLDDPGVLDWLRSECRLDPSAARRLRDYVARQAQGRGGGPRRPDGPGRDVPRPGRGDRPGGPHAVRRQAASRPEARAPGPAPRAAGDHGLVPARRRRGLDPAPAGRRAPAGRLRRALGREGRGLDPRRAGRQRPVRPPVPPERGEGLADAPPRPRQEVSALAAAAPRQGLAPGRAPGAGLPDPGRDLPRVPG